MLMVNDSSSDVTEMLPLYVLKMAESTGWISMAIFYVSMLMVDDSSSDAMEITPLHSPRRLVHRSYLSGMCTNLMLMRDDSSSEATEMQALHYLRWLSQWVVSQWNQCYFSVDRWW